MSTVNAKNIQVGNSGTASQNFTLYQPSTPDGTVRLGVGNSGSTTSDAVEFNSSAGISKVAGYPSYQCRAWVQFKGTGTVTISTSGNVSSITDNGNGNYTVNFTASLSDTQYAAVGSTSTVAGGYVGICQFYAGGLNTGNFQVEVKRQSDGSAQDSDYINIAVFR